MPLDVEPVGLLGFRCLRYVAGKFFSPIYTGDSWNTKWQESICATYLETEAPCDKHSPGGGCGFHGMWTFEGTKEFLRQRSGTSEVIFLSEYAGKIAVHENGLRGQYCRVLGVINWNPRDSLFIQLVYTHRAESLVPEAVRHFKLPLLEPPYAEDLVYQARLKHGDVIITDSGFSNLPI